MNSEKQLSSSEASASDLGKDQATDTHQEGDLTTDDLPSRFVIAIDGWAHSGKNTLGERLAKILDCVLVDSGRFYRAFTKACLNADLDVNDEALVGRFCESATLQIRLSQENEDVTEIQVGINGQWFNKNELKNIGVEVSKVARVSMVRQLVNKKLRACESYGRVIMLGRDIGSVVMPFADYKYFLTAPEYVREERHRASTGQSGALARDRMDADRVAVSEDAIVIDTDEMTAQEVFGLVLINLAFTVS